MEHFPPKSRANLKPECNIVQRCDMAPSNNTGEQRTACTRRIHFIYWCKIRGIYDEIFPIIKLSPTGIMYVMAFYAAFLVTGHAIALKSIKSGTVKKYLSI